MGITILPEWGEKLGEALSGITTGVATIKDPHWQAKKAITERVMADPELAQKFVDTMHLNPGLLEQMGLDKLAGSLAGGTASPDAQLEVAMRPYMQEAQGDPNLMRANVEKALTGRLPWENIIGAMNAEDAKSFQAFLDGNPGAARAFKYKKATGGTEAEFKAAQLDVSDMDTVTQYLQSNPVPKMMDLVKQIATGNTNNPGILSALVKDPRTKDAFEAAMKLYDQQLDRDSNERLTRLRVGSERGMSQGDRRLAMAASAWDKAGQPGTLASYYFLMFGNESDSNAGMKRARAVTQKIEAYNQMTPEEKEKHPLDVDADDYELYNSWQAQQKRAKSGDQKKIGQNFQFINNTYKLAQKEKDQERLKAYVDEINGALDENRALGGNAYRLEYDQPDTRGGMAKFFQGDSAKVVAKGKPIGPLRMKFTNVDTGEETDLNRIVGATLGQTQSTPSIPQNAGKTTTSVERSRGSANTTAQPKANSTTTRPTAAQIESEATRLAGLSDADWNKEANELDFSDPVTKEVWNKAIAKRRGAK